MLTIKFNTIKKTLLILIGITLIIWTASVLNAGRVNDIRTQEQVTQEIEAAKENSIISLFSKYGGRDEPIRLLAFGDLLLDRYVRTLINRNGKDSVLAGVQGLNGEFFEGHDFVFANLEGPVTPTRIATGKEIAFQFDPDYLSILTDNNFNIVSTANNHTYDMGNGGYTNTLKNLADVGIASVGDARGVNENSYFETKVDGYYLAFAAFNHTDFKLNIEDALITIRDLAARNDFVIVSIHWGEEYRHKPYDWQRDWARRIVGAGADVILGHHPHVLQGIEFINNRPVFYSLGNFVFDQWLSDITRETVAVKLELKKSRKGKTIKIRLVPIWIEKSLPEFPTYEKGKEIIEKLYDYSRRVNPEIETRKALFDNWTIEVKY